jgi:hypothetical protein
MSLRGILVGLGVAALIGLGGFLWNRQGAMVWLQDAIRYCF